MAPFIFTNGRPETAPSDRPVKQWEKGGAKPCSQFHKNFTFKILQGVT